MSCPDPDHVIAYIARRLPADERDAIEAHIDGCKACRALLVALAQTNDGEPFVPPAPTGEPTQVGRYRIEKRLGEGGMGTVYAAHDPQLDRKVALKLVHPELAAHGGLERLIREGRALARLSHPNVVAVHDAGSDGDRVYIAMELIEGQTLAAWLRDKPRTWREIVRMFVAAGRGLAAAHAAGVIHRDVKPENVLIDRGGRPKVADFGLAGSEAGSRAFADLTDPDSRLTIPNAVMGTPAFMSPEQRRGEVVTPATDQYSLSAALWRALFDDEPDRRVPAWLRRALERGLAQDAKQRFPSIDALVDELDVDRRDRRRRRWLVAAGAVAALGGAAGAAYAVGRPDEDTLANACAAEHAARATLWTAADRDAIATAIQRTGSPLAAETTPRVAAALDRSLEELATTETKLCAQAPREREGRELVVAGLACLHDRREALAAVIAQLRSVQRKDVSTAVSLVHSVNAPDDCGNPAILAEERTIAANPAAAAARAEIMQSIDAAKRAFATGTFKDALVHAKRAEQRARPFGGALLIYALIERGKASATVEGYPQSEAAFREAVTVAESIGADDIRAYAMAQLMHSISREPGREKEALALYPLVEAAVKRSGKQQEMATMLQLSVGVAKLRLGQIADAVADMQAALAAARKVLPQGDPRLPEFLHPTALALSYAGRDAEALALNDEAVAIATQVFGPNHPETARYMINRATKRAATGHCDQALVELARARELIGDQLPADSLEHLQIDQAMGACYYMQRDYDKALAEYKRRQDALVAGGREKSVDMASSWVDVGDIYYDRKQYDQALANYRRAVSEHESLLGLHDARIGFALARIGEVELAANRPADAIAPLERALALYEEAKITPNFLANVQWPLARALWDAGRDRKRARDLAEAARKTSAASSMPIHQERAKTIERWLADHR
ncbi:MAG TPA: tetratricopeptide repeat protein [Kofleriaceae bacterium]|nr:tetratricopeptide repeat protein [Kofleriaceae bacterium]